jgi:hypothetical protein
MTDPNEHTSTSNHDIERTPVSLRSTSFDEESSLGTSASPFFADATLDLEDAHDLADTPVATSFRKRFDHTKVITGNKQSQLGVPVLSYNSDTDETGTPSKTTTTSSAIQPPGPSTVTSSRTATSSSSNNNNTREKSNFSRITSLESDLQRNNQELYGNKLPRWPRDIPWAVAFCLLIPVSFIWPILIEKHDQDLSPLVLYPFSTATLHTLWWAAVATFFLSRLLYLSVGGGEGDEARHVAAQVLTASAPISVAVYMAMALQIIWSCPQARFAALIPIWYTVRDVYLFRRWKRRSQQAGSGSRQAFFQAITGMALDILSRSLRRASFYRVLSVILMVQLVVLLLWRWALLGALGSGSWTVLIVAMVGGKWATGTVARLLSLLACGGITSWFAQQTALLSELPQSPIARKQTEGSQGDDGDADDQVNGDDGLSMPEAYRTVDASVYQSVLDADEGLDDDYEMDDDEFMEAPSRRRATQNSNAPATRSTVKSILSAGLTVSFGSVAQCGLVGGPAQFIWSQVRKVEAAQNVISRARGDGGFQGMQVGNDDTSLISKLWNRINMLARSFVRRHSDLAMSHVAAYYKSYQKAARDVATLIDESGKLVASKLVLRV